MRAIQIREFGDNAELHPAEIPEPRPGEGEVLLQVKAAGVNYADILMRRGEYAGRLPLPYVPGFEAAGVILETGKKVNGWRPGQRVMGTAARSRGGCYAEKAILPAGGLLAIPEGLAYQEAAAFPEAFLTAYLALHVNGRLAEGEQVLIHAAGGGVGTAAVQLARASGARILATAGSEEKLRKVKALGADVVINYVAQDFLSAVQKETGGQGVDLVLESVGGEVFDKSLKCLRPLGRLVTYGVTSGRVPSANALDLIQRMICVSGFSLGALSVTHPGLVAESLRGVGELLLRGKVRPVVGHTLPLVRAGEAHQLISSRSSFGKVVLLP